MPEGSHPDSGWRAIDRASGSSKLGRACRFGTLPRAYILTRTAMDIDLLFFNRAIELRNSVINGGVPFCLTKNLIAMAGYFRAEFEDRHVRDVVADILANSGLEMVSDTGSAAISNSPRVP